MKPALFLPKLGRKTRILLVFLLLVATLVALFDWNWFRHPLERYLVEKSSREVRIEDLHVKLGFTLEPAVRLRGVYIENAAWAAKRPLAVVGEASFTVSLKSLWQRRPRISKLVLIDADIDLERQADGLRNWRLTRPDDKGPGRVRVMTLEAHRSKMRFVNRAIDLEFVAIAEVTGRNPGLDPGSGSGVRGDQQNKGLSTRISFEGTYQGAPFSGDALTGDLLSFRESGLSFPLRGHLTSGKTRLELDGFFTDVFDLGPMDARVRVAGATLSQLHPFLRIRPPASRPFSIEAQLTQTHGVYKFAQLRGKIGDTDIAGEATYDRSQHRPRVLASLQSEVADIADLRSLIGMQPSRRAGTAGKLQAKAAEAPDEQRQAVLNEEETDHPGKIFPSQPLRAERLLTVDGRVTMSAKKLKAAEMPMLENLRLDAALTDGVLELNPVNLGVAGGQVVASITLDGREQPPSLRANLELRDIRLERLVPSLSASGRAAGVLHGQIKLAGQGNSVAKLLGNSTGSLIARVDGGRISNLADAKLSLNFGKIVSLFFRGDRDIALNCAAIALDIRNGTGKSQTIVFDTEHTHTNGVGSINLRDERWDVLLTPQPKKPGFLTQRASIRIDGSFKNAKISFQERVAIEPRQCAAARDAREESLRRAAPAR